MTQNLKCKIYGYIQSAYLKSQNFLLKTADRFHEKCIKYLVDRLLRNSDAQNLEAELNRYHKSFGYLLEPTTLFLQGIPTAYFSTGESLDKAWRYCLDDDTPCLQQFYNKLHQTAPNAALRFWIDYLRNHGFCRVLENEDTVEISSTSRKYFDNTLGIEDGTILPIESHPWTYTGDLIAGGMVKR